MFQLFSRSSGVLQHANKLEKLFNLFKIELGKHFVILDSNRHNSTYLKFELFSFFKPVRKTFVDVKNITSDEKCKIIQRQRKHFGAKTINS